jgi:hypothetical protein
MKFKIILSILTLSAISQASMEAQPAQDYLANNTVLIVRHTEKPETGNGLTAQGEERARLYAKYFEPFHEEGLSISVDCLYAGADSKNSIRPRLTLEPISKATGLPLHLNIGTKDSEDSFGSYEPSLTVPTHSLPGATGKYPLCSRHSELPLTNSCQRANGRTMFLTGSSCSQWDQTGNYCQQG